MMRLYSSLCIIALVPFLAAADNDSDRRRSKRKLTGYPQLYVAGNNGKPTNAFPLGECQGDCDGDYECAYGLSCFDHPSDPYVPGCSGTRSTNQQGDYNDYCYRAPSKPTPKPTYKPTPYPTQKPTPKPAPKPQVQIVAGQCKPTSKCGMCQGDCDNDSDCEYGLYCYHRDQNEAIPVPYCNGGDYDYSRTDYCTHY